MTNSKATKATIKLGEIELDCYQMPDGEYGFSYEWLAEYLEIDKQLLSDKKSPFYIYNHNKDISKELLSSRRVLVEGISNAKLNYLTCDELMILMGSLAKINNAVLDLLVACAIEALERRADSAFGIVRSENERNQFLKTRTEGKMARRTLTNSIQDYITRHGKIAPYTSFVWSNVSDYGNLMVLGYKAKQLKQMMDLKPTASLRDTIPEAALRELRFIEEMAGRLMDEDDVEPLLAIKQAAILCKVKTVGYQ